MLMLLPLLQAWPLGGALLHSILFLLLLPMVLAILQL
jgi:hypothetical protein